MFAIIQTLVLKAIFIFGVTLFGFFASWYHYREEYLFQFFKNDDLASEFDYIVVGAGSAGAILALRLAEQDGGSNSVLLLEAGSYGGPILNIPLSSSLIQLTDVDWQYKTAPQANACKAFDNNQCLWPRGKLIGGSSRLNNMIHFEGHPMDYPQWFSAHNYTSAIKPYFDRIRNYLISDNHTPYLTELSEALLDAGREVLGVPIRDGFATTGFMVPKNNIKNGKRYLSGEYLMENKPGNLKVMTHSYAEKVVVEHEGGLFEAKGVVFSRFGNVKKVFASKAVILSAGAISSPHILMLSGLGPSSHLLSHFITPVIDLPQVGQNLQDHVTTGFDLFHLEQPLESVTPATLISPWAFLRYNLFADGPWTFNQCDAIAILYMNCLKEDFGGGSSNETYEECERRQKGPPDLELMLIPLGFNSDMGVILRKIFGLKYDMWENYISQHIHLPTFFILPVVLHPKSIGHISLTSSSPTTPPTINPNYLSHPYDVHTLIRGLRLVQMLVKQGTVFRDTLAARLNDRKLPGCQQWQFDTSEYWECYVRQVTLSVYHPVGTCRMGSDGKSSVVNTEFLVHGTKNLYVVDASVMPSLPSGNINAATVMLAEKASDIIITKYSEEEKTKEYVNTLNIRKESGQEQNEDNDLKKVKVDDESFQEEADDYLQEIVENVEDKTNVQKDEF